MYKRIKSIAPLFSETAGTSPIFGIDPARQTVLKLNLCDSLAVKPVHRSCVRNAAWWAAGSSVSQLKKVGIVLT